MSGKGNSARSDAAKYWNTSYNFLLSNLNINRLSKIQKLSLHRNQSIDLNYKSVCQFLDMEVRHSLKSIISLENYLREDHNKLINILLCVCVTHSFLDNVSDLYQKKNELQIFLIQLYNISINIIKESRWPSILNHIRLMLPSYRNQSLHLRCKSIDWFLYECNTGLMWVQNGGTNLRFLSIFHGTVYCLL